MARPVLPFKFDLRLFRVSSMTPPAEYESFMYVISLDWLVSNLEKVKLNIGCAEGRRKKRRTMMRGRTF